MKIVIPAAGQGTRLRPHTHTVPKVLLPVAGLPIIGHILTDITPLEPEEIRLVVGYRGETLAAYAAEAFPDLPIRIVWQTERLGLGHAVLQALDEDDRGPVLVILGDTVFDVDYARIVARTVNVLGVRRVPDPERFGIVELDATGERVVRLVEKPSEPKDNLALVGLYYLQDGQALRTAIAGLVAEDRRSRGEYQLTDGLQRMIDGGETFVPFEIGQWFDCGKPATLLDTNRELLDRRRPASTPIAGDFSAIVPPVFIGEGCTIENAVVGPHVSMSRGATVRDAVVRDSIIGERATIQGLVLERSIIGPGVRAVAAPRILNLGQESELTC
ncbi:MAG TPA: sugar phosphate nucleotidyltransferase [Gemmatimonadota bacterium]|nr:sugar phosphate nucleotidyltransferase [Gemmatimonadota bacterium]